MYILTAHVMKGDWFVAKDEGSTFTITTNKSRAKQFSSRRDAEEFNTRHIALQNISDPFTIHESR